MEKLLAEIYSIDESTIKKYEKHLMLGGGTRGIPVIKKGKGVRVYDVDNNLI